MSLRHRVVLPVIAIFFLAFLVACGSGAHSPVPPPTGGFSNTNFNGTYTFSLLGANGNGVFAMAGSLVACGCSAGTISGGSVELVDPVGATGASTINSGTYNITQDGRGKANLSISTSTRGTVQITLDFVLTSSSHGLIIRFDGNGTGSGTIDLQPSAVSQSSLASSYAFSLSGSDVTVPQQLPLSGVGAFTLDTSGAIVASPAGVADFNYNATASTQLVLTGSVLVGSGNAPGSASLNTSFGNLTFDVFAIDSTHLKLIENDGLAILVGDVFAQPTATIPAGNLVFTMAGLDTSGFPFAAGGLMTSDGTSSITTGSEDVNDNGVVDGGTTTPAGFTGTFAATGGGRFQVNLSGFIGGTLFAAYPSDGGLLMLEVDTGLNAGITGGVALTQTGTSITAATGYGLNLTGADNNGEVDEIAEFTASSSAFTGLLDENEGGVPNSPKNLSGTYSVGSEGLGSATLNAGFASMFFYIADSSTVVFISTDSTQVAVGAFQTQTAPTAAQAAVVQRHLAMLRSVPRSRSVAKRGQTRIGH